MIQDLQVVMMYVVRCKNYTVSCVRTFLRTSLLLEFSRNFDLRVNMIIIQYGIVLNLYVYARFDWQIIFARRNDRSRERKKNHGSRASFRMCGTRVNNFSIKKKLRKRRAIPECLRGSSRFCSRFTQSAAYYMGLPHHWAKRVYNIVRAVLDDWRASGRAIGWSGLGTCLTAIPVFTTCMFLYIIIIISSGLCDFSRDNFNNCN